VGVVLLKHVVWFGKGGIVKLERKILCLKVCIEMGRDLASCGMMSAIKICLNE
jgi:hypothetical protein